MTARFHYAFLVDSNVKQLLSYSFDNFLHWCREKRQELSLDIAALDLAKEAIGAHEVTCKISSVA